MKRWRPVRPRRGVLLRAEGGEVPVRFRWVGHKTYLAVYADDRTPVHLGAGDRLFIDVIGPGQGVQYGSVT